MITLMQTDDADEMTCWYKKYVESSVNAAQKSSCKSRFAESIKGRVYGFSLHDY